MIYHEGQKEKFLGLERAGQTLCVHQLEWRSCTAKGSRRRAQKGIVLSERTVRSRLMANLIPFNKTEQQPLLKVLTLCSKLTMSQSTQQLLGNPAETYQAHKETGRVDP